MERKVKIENSGKETIKKVQEKVKERLPYLGVQFASSFGLSHPIFYVQV